ncbi:MAG: hypothetical protein AB7W47_17130 [Calditrichaceae bacterium]
MKLARLRREGIETGAAVGYQLSAVGQEESLRLCVFVRDFRINIAGL